VWGFASLSLKNIKNFALSRYNENCYAMTFGGD
jgi:hypothetical protein